MKWRGCFSGAFAVSRGARQDSVFSAYLFNIFINQLLSPLHDFNTAVVIGDIMYNSFAYADDISLFSPNPSGLQRVIEYICVQYSLRWRFKFMTVNPCVCFLGNAHLQLSLNGV